MLQITVSELPKPLVLLQVTDFLLQQALEMLQIQEGLLQKSGWPPHAFTDLQHHRDEMLQINPEMLRIIVDLMPINVDLMQVDLDLQQKIRNGPSVILGELPRKDAGSLGIVDLLQVGPDLQQSEPVLL